MRRPEVPGFWPSNGVVATVRTAVMASSSPLTIYLVMAQETASVNRAGRDAGPMAIYRSAPLNFILGAGLILSFGLSNYP
ncbi:hypothetical protein MTBUT4_130044 [Magnetospirillum sp. UT-4]|nr:hypothetical protein MTBUT4_130044 [Magnetospirillum sp. UT-4]